MKKEVSLVRQLYYACVLSFWLIGGLSATVVLEYPLVGLLLSGALLVWWIRNFARVAARMGAADRALRRLGETRFTANPVMFCPCCESLLIPGEKRLYETSAEHAGGMGDETPPLRTTWVCSNPKCPAQDICFWDFDGGSYTLNRKLASARELPKLMEAYNSWGRKNTATSCFSSGSKLPPRRTLGLGRLGKLLGLEKFQFLLGWEGVADYDGNLLRKWPTLNYLWDSVYLPKPIHSIVLTLRWWNSATIKETNFTGCTIYGAPLSWPSRVGAFLNRWIHRKTWKELRAAKVDPRGV